MKMESSRILSDQQISKDDKKRFKAQKLFMQHLFDQHESFARKIRERVNELNKDFPEIVRAPAVLELYYGVVLDDWGRADISQETAKQYFDRLLTDIPRCLRPENNGITWILEELHSRVITASFGIAVHSFAFWGEHPIDRIRVHLDIETEICPKTRRENIEEWANLEVKRQIEQKWKRVEANPRYERRLRQEQNLKRNVKWLFRHIFHGYSGANMGRVFPEDSGNYAPEYINLTIRQTAKLLGIRLPRGRPTKAKKR